MKKRNKRILWILVYVLPGLTAPFIFCGLVVYSRSPLAGTAISIKALPAKVSLPPTFDDCPLSNIRWHFTDAFTGVFAIVGESSPEEMKRWLEKVHAGGEKISYATFDPYYESPNDETFQRAAPGDTILFSGAYQSGYQYCEFLVGKQTVVIVSRK